MASRAINSSVVSVISVATRNADRDLSQGGPRHATEIETNSTTKGKASGMALQGKGKRSGAQPLSGAESMDVTVKER
jgi:hypothetical protein